MAENIFPSAVTGLLGRGFWASPAENERSTKGADGLRSGRRCEVVYRYRRSRTAAVSSACSGRGRSRQTGAAHMRCRLVGRASGRWWIRPHDPGAGAKQDPRSRQFSSPRGPRAPRDMGSFDPHSRFSDTRFGFQEAPEEPRFPGHEKAADRKRGVGGSACAPHPRLLYPLMAKPGFRTSSPARRFPVLRRRGPGTCPRSRRQPA